MPLLLAHPGASLEQVLTAQRDGQPMRQTDRPAADALAPVMEELRLQIAQQSLFVIFPGQEVIS
jgi:hypothetical protein